ncbi:MAG: hypothetical protein ACTSVI_09535 [Promethearchaeota archaeon]
MNKHPDLTFLHDRLAFKKFLMSFDSLTVDDKNSLLEKLQEDLRSSSWVSKDLYKPGIRNLFIQEKLSAKNMYQNFVKFLGDQEYHFKFFFQNMVSKGKIPTVMDFLRQAINTPRFRFRSESIDLLIEINGKAAIINLINLIAGLNTEKNNEESRLVIERIKSNLDLLSSRVNNDTKLMTLLEKLKDSITQVQVQL